MQVGIGMILIFIFQTNPGQIYQDVYNNQFEEVPDFDAGLEKILNDEDFAFFYQVESVDSLIENPCDVSAVGDALLTAQIALTFRKNFPYRNLFNH